MAQGTRERRSRGRALAWTFTGLAGSIAGTMADSAVSSWLDPYARVGRATMIFAMVALMFGLLASQGYVPGIEATDHGMPAKP